MRFSILVLSVFFAGAANAVITDKCPESMDLNVPSIQKFSKSFIDKRIEDRRFNFDSGESYDAESIEFFLQKDEISEGFSVELELTRKENSNCYYSQQSLWGGVIDARITGTDKKPILTVTYTNEEEVYEDEQFIREILMFGLISQRNPKYSVSGVALQIKTLGEQTNWGEWFAVYIPVGRAMVD